MTTTVIKSRPRARTRPETTQEEKDPQVRRVLNVGSGPYSPRKLHPVFSGADWIQLRLDIDPDAKPDLLGSIIDVGDLIENESFDAVWCSHILEHLHEPELAKAMAEIRRILKPDGFLLLTSPDLESVAELLIEKGLDHVAYNSPAGPITVLDMIYGHTASISRGKHYMAHNTGFTEQRIGELLIRSGFDLCHVKRGAHWDLWALGLKDRASSDEVLGKLRASGLDLVEDEA
ncbi:class I SAM-dependent methyltransferase [Terrihabitans rhizophilus]|jgi:SAM-dependent methyltransferase|uniref:Methyltransferase domain-containing protein n=1 Tax=Terrihabitans rhizophilus TaxID=3092662 RepID=A0ABU4RLU3_9HYPH|nr:methyltransferase domain-containing protein [Terrihabitans sp. PJ23]MDX6805793.1 methyltransferase domain-containing protein [Terrihabitans sp. PJ23]